MWEHEPKPITPSEKVTIFYDTIIPAGSFIEGKAVRPDIVIWNKEEQTAKIIEVTVPTDFGISAAETRKISKYQDLRSDLKKTWKLKDAEIIPVVIGATGLMKNNLKNYLRSIPGCPTTYEVQLAAIKGTVTILKRALGYNAK